MFSGKYFCLLTKYFLFCSLYRLHKLLKVEPDNEKVYFNLAMLAMDEQSFDQAYVWFLKAIEVSWGELSLRLL